MRAYVVDHGVPGHFRLTDVPEPTPGPDEALVRVHAASVNPADLGQAEGAPDGSVAGFETSGVVVREAADGSGPPRGTPVTGVAVFGGWAELRAMPTRLLGTVPRDVDLVAAATLPIAAGSALRALRELGPILGRRVLVTGATGAVGAYAVQLAALGGADVVATCRTPDRVPWLRELGANEVLARPAEHDGPVDCVLDNVGGSALTEAFALLTGGGSLVSVGRAARDEIVLAPDDLLGDWDRAPRTIRTFFLLHGGAPGLDRDLTLLARLVGEGRLRPQVDRVEEFEQAADVLAGRSWTGKLVLRTAAT